ncbi:MAG TPA: cation acetate symporter [Kineosporiaceae bacterium]
MAGPHPTWPAVVAVVLVCLGTVGLGAVGLRLSRTTSDFYVASRVVSPRWNASAIGGEYLSAASFLGVAGLVLAFGVDMLWYPVGYTAGYLVLLVLVAAPLRRSGAYTLPDFAQIRFRSQAVRRIASVLVVGIGWLYLLPQFKAAGLALRTVTGAPSWLGALVVAGVVTVNVVAGGMRSITIVQAFQFWLKLTAIALPVFLLAIAWRADGAPDPSSPGQPALRHATTVRLTEPVTVRVEEPVTVRVDGVVNRQATHGDLHLTVGTASFDAGTTLTLTPGEPVPHVEQAGTGSGPDWATPFVGTTGRDHPLYRIYSLLLALLFGTMGLPHVLVRFYTNPDGRAARRTTLVVIGLLGTFYLFPPFYGAMGRLYAPDLLLTGRTDAVVLLLPGRMLPSPWADFASALVTAGAFAAFLSTSSGLTVSVAGVLSQDLLRGRLRNSVAGFRLGTLLAVAVPAMLSLLTLRTSLADTVGLAFAIAASTFCPLLVLGIWWRRLSVTGALAGLLVGGGLAGGAVLTTMATGSRSGLAGALLAQPAAWSVPTAFAVMILVSLRTRGAVPGSTGRMMVRLHAPERLHLDAARLPADRRERAPDPYTPALGVPIAAQPQPVTPELPER